MITNCIDKLITGDFFNISEEVEIAKGKYQIKKGLISRIRSLRRKIKYKK